MNINLSVIDTDNFLIKEGIFCGIQAKLVNPNHIGTKFTQENKIFRSSIWSNEGELLSAGFYKFTNLGENPENFPVPTSLNNTTCVEKLDGSLNIIDYVNNQISMRTRGTFSYKTMENYEDFEYCLSKYPKVTEWLKENPKYSLLTEIVSPKLKIVISYGNEPDLWLIGAVNKLDYSLIPQYKLDELAIELGIKRPKTYTFDSIPSLITTIEQWKGKEGIVIYSENDQTLHKIKSLEYIFKHRLKSELSNIDRVIDLWFEKQRPDRDVFIKYITDTFDFEILEAIQHHIDIIYTGNDILNSMVINFKAFVETLKLLPTRKERAMKILSEYKPYSSFLFALLDKGELTLEQEKKLLYVLMEKE